MAADRTDRAFATSRRAFLMTTGGALAGMAAFGLVDPAAAAKRHPQRGGILQYGPSNDVAGLDAHTHNQNHVVMTTTVMYTGLTDLDYRGQHRPRHCRELGAQQGAHRLDLPPAQGGAVPQRPRSRCRGGEAEPRAHQEPRHRRRLGARRDRHHRPAPRSSTSTRSASIRVCPMCPCRRT